MMYMRLCLCIWNDFLISKEPRGFVSSSIGKEWEFRVVRVSMLMLGCPRKLGSMVRISGL